MTSVDTDIFLTTLDNPYNPFTHDREWEAWDLNAGYKTSSYLARVALIAEGIQPYEEEAATLRAVRDIVLLDPSGMFVAVHRDGKLVSDEEMASWLC